MQEVKNLCTQGTGCQHDHRRIWTSTEVLPDKYLSVCGNKNHNACSHTGIQEVKSVPTDKLAIRCCSNNDLGSGSRKWGQCDVWSVSEINGVCHRGTYIEAKEKMSYGICVRQEQDVVMI